MKFVVGNTQIGKHSNEDTKQNFIGGNLPHAGNELSNLSILYRISHFSLS
jgi:hypothetical protein